MKPDDALPKMEMHWPSVLLYIHLHALGIYGLWLLLFEAKWLTVIFVTLLVLVAELGITTGAHRLWAHRSYTGTRPLRFFLMIAHTLAGVGTIQNWVLAHRIHHKYFGTEKDPFNHKKGFVYSHILSNVMTKDPNYEKIVKEIDMCDIESDGFVFIQKKLYWILLLSFGLLLPINAPVEYWGESLFNSVFIVGFLRLAITLHMSWLVNSASLIWGLKPGEKYPAEDNWVFFITRSWWPLYHYMLPWDYKTGEYGSYDSGGITSMIQIWKVIGLATSLKTSGTEDIRKALARVVNTGITLEESLKQVSKSADEIIIKERLIAKH